MKGEEWIGLLNSSRRRCSHSGDTLQGTPLIYYHNKLNNAPTDPMMLVMNSLGYDSMTPGNHEFNFGLKVLEKASSEAQFPFLSANTYTRTRPPGAGISRRDLINKVQLYYTGADLSVAAAFTTDPQIQKGPVTVRQMFSVYIYDNTLCAIEVTGQQIKDALEHSTKFYNTYDFGAANTPLVNPNIRGYNCDMLAGASYKIDVSKPTGQRIYDLKYKGAPMDPNAKFRLAINNYRVNGGSGYSMFKGDPVLYKSSEEIRNLMVEYVKKMGTISPDVDNNWALIPDYLFDANKDKFGLLVRQGILNPDPHPEFYPSGKMITSDFLKHLAKAFNLKPIGVKSDDDKDDKEDADDWIEPHGLAKGNPAVLKRAVIRQQAATLAVKALKKGKVELEEVDEDKLEKYPDYEAVAPWARKAMAVALDRGIIAPTSDGRLNPEAELSVSEAVALLADAGDMMQGTAISNVLRGKPVIEVMNRIGYDAAAVGNHEFDWTVKVLEERMDEAGFPFLAANLFEKTTGKRVDWAKPYTILKRRGLKVAIIGVTTPETAFTTLPANVADIEFRDPALVINQLAKELREDGVNLVLVAGHLGGAVDKTGAITGPAADVASAVYGVDAIAGGHTHNDYIKAETASGRTIDPVVEGRITRVR